MSRLADGIVSLKRGLVSSYRGNSTVYEAVPLAPSELVPIDAQGLESLHRFAKNNPIYDCSSQVRICGVDCTVYEGDINNYWLDSKKHDASYAPFYPTWMLSAYALAAGATDAGARQALDIGAGDGRIAYCCEAAGIKSYGIEIDSGLVALQRRISDSTGVEFDAIESDATLVEYSKMGLDKPVLFIGGLPQVGEILAAGVIERVLPVTDSAVFVLTGANPESGPAKSYGWDELLHRFGLSIDCTLTLPTRWTVDQLADTPYIFASCHSDV